MWFLFFPPSLAVFFNAISFNSDVSKWNMGVVTNMWASKCTLSPSLPLCVSLWPHTLFCCCVFLNDKTRVSSDHKIPTRSSVIFVAPSFLQCFIPQLRSTRTCPNGILGRWQICMPVSVLSLFPSPFRCVVFLNACAKLVFHHNNSHTFCYVVCGGLVFLFFLFIAVFVNAWAFNQDVSKWNTGAVTDMSWSKCPSLLLCIFVYFNIRQLEFHLIIILTRSVLCCWNGTFVVVCVGLVFPFLCCTLLSCSVLWGGCVQFRRVQMEYGGGDNYV